jgi:hypothetical protein
MKEPVTEAVRNLVWMCAKFLWAIILARVGYTLGLILAIDYLGDHGDVRSAFIGTFITIPLGVIAGALAGWFSMRGLERLFVRQVN